MSETYLCQLCGTNSSADDVYNHVESYHVGTRPTGGLFDIACGDCSFKSNEREGSHFINHIFRTKHRGSEIKLCWAETMERELKRVAEIIASGVQLLEENDCGRSRETASDTHSDFNHKLALAVGMPNFREEIFSESFKTEKPSSQEFFMDANENTPFGLPFPEKSEEIPKLTSKPVEGNRMSSLDDSLTGLDESLALENISDIDDSSLPNEGSGDNEEIAAQKSPETQASTTSIVPDNPMPNKFEEETPAQKYFFSKQDESKTSPISPQSSTSPNGSSSSQLGNSSICTCPNCLARNPSDQGPRIHICLFPECRKTFGRLNKLKTHLYRHQNNRAYTCDEPGCLKGYFRDCDLRRHKMKHKGLVFNGIRTVYSCGRPSCQIQFFDIHKLKRHGKTHEEKKEFTCDHCGWDFARSDGLVRHLKKHWRDEYSKSVHKQGRASTSSGFSQGSEGFANVKSGNISYENFPNFLRDANIRVTLDRDQSQITQKDESSITMEGKDTGSDQMHLSGRWRKRCTCPNCASRKPWEKAQRIHVCRYEGCRKTFEHRTHLEVHLLRHENITPYVCSQIECGKRFFRAHDLRRHETAHLDSRPFLCSECDQGFLRQDNLMRHIEKKHPEDVH